jgi:hypothetical protein
VVLLNNSSDTMPYCIQSLALRARALPSYYSRNGIGNITTDSEFTFTETEPYTDGYYYLLVVSESQVSFNLLVSTAGKKILCKEVCEVFSANTLPCYECKLLPLSVYFWCVILSFLLMHFIIVYLTLRILESIYTRSSKEVSGLHLLEQVHIK